jgi:hypothetical protein
MSGHENPGKNQDLTPPAAASDASRKLLRLAATELQRRPNDVPENRR